MPRVANSDSPSGCNQEFFLLVQFPSHCSLQEGEESLASKEERSQVYPDSLQL